LAEEEMKEKMLAVCMIGAALLTSSCNGPESQARKAFEGVYADMSAVHLSDVKRVTRDGVNFTCGKVSYGTGGSRTFIIEGNGVPTVLDDPAIAGVISRECLD
jgi:hypothetical protein